jgi:RNA recognition motif-containing protein
LFPLIPSSCVTRMLSASVSHSVSVCLCRSKGCGIVEYSHINAAARALTSLNGVELRGRPIYVREDRIIGRSSAGQRQSKPAPAAASSGEEDGNSNSGEGGSGEGDGDDTGGETGGEGNSGEGDGSGIVVLESPRVFVSNLPFEASWQDVKDFFRQVSECQLRLRLRLRPALLACCV